MAWSLGRSNSAARAVDVSWLAALACLVGALYARGLTGHLLKVRDWPVITLPSKSFLRASWLDGQLPFWNPLVGFGIPTLAAPIHGALYVGQLPLLVGSLATGVALTWALHTWWAGAGAYALGRSIGCSPSSAAVAMLVTAIGGYETSMVWNGEKVLVYAWVPWTAWAVRRAVAGPSPGRVIVAAVAGAAICYAGDPFLLFDAAILTLPFAAEAALSATTSWPARLRSLSLGFALPMILACLLAMPVLLPAALLRPETRRAVVTSAEEAQAWSMHPLRWLEAFVPSPFGDAFTPRATLAPKRYADAPMILEPPWAASLYVGAATAGLASLARGRLAAWIAGAAGFAALLAVGKYLPVLGWVRALVPPLAFARYPEKHAFVACEALAFLAALGFERVIQSAAGSRRRWLSPVPVCVAGLAIAVLFAPAYLRTTVHEGALHAGVILAATATVLAVSVMRPSAASLVPVVLAVDLTLTAMPLLRWDARVGLPDSPLIDALGPRSAPYPRRVLRPPLPVLSHFFPDIDALPGNAATVYGVSVVPGADFARSPKLDTLFPTQLGGSVRPLETLRADGVVLTRDGARVTDPDVALFGVVRAPELPRAWIVGRVEHVADREAVSRLFSLDWDFEGTATVAEDLPADAAAVLGRAPAGAAGRCAVERFANTAVDVACHADRPGLFVMADQLSSGWTAAVDGDDRPLLHADVLYRGVVMSAGDHRLALRYEPPGLVPGLLVAALTFLGWAFVAVRARASEAKPAETARP